MYKCKYCGREFETSKQLNGHVAWCKEKPGYNEDEKKKQLENARSKINTSNIAKKYECKYCGKCITGKGNLIKHENSCKLNPLRKISKRELRQLNKQPRKHTEETKKIISEKRKQWLKNNKDKHSWCKHNKFVSVPCEYVKKFLDIHNISYVAEFQPLSNRYFSIDIAFPNKKIGIEINGNQHYDTDGNLAEYYKSRHELIESAGWKLYEIHYSKCFDYNNSFFNQLLTLDIKEDDYTDFIRNYKNKKQDIEKNKEKIKQEKVDKRAGIFNEKRNILLAALKNCNIDFSIFGWSEKFKKYLQENNLFYEENTLRMIKKYCPEFLSNTNVFIRKGCKL